MRVAVISDVHANKHALEAVLEDIKKQSPDLTVCLGDLVGYGAFPDEVVQKIRDSGMPVVMGNYDDAIANRRLVCGCDFKNEKEYELGLKSLAWTVEHTSEESKEFLRGLPAGITREVGRMRVLFVHGSPRRLNKYLYEDVPAGEIMSMLQEQNANVLVCGHTHLPYHRELGGLHVVNAGSVGKPKHGDPSAMYALLDLDTSVRVRFIKVPYDHEAAAAAVEKAGLPAQFAAILRTGRPG